MRLLKQLLVVFAVLVVLAGVLTIFSFDIIKIKWVSFMGLQPSFSNMEQPLPVPARSIPIEGPAYIPNMGVPKNPVPADVVSIARGAQLFGTHCIMCHGAKGEGNGQLAALLANRPANLTLPITQTKSDSALFLTITNGVAGRMPAMNENLTVRERWDVINFLRTLAAPAP
jgi:mono/diheme cytochrome c family protein